MNLLLSNVKIWGVIEELLWILYDLFGFGRFMIFNSGLVCL